MIKNYQENLNWKILNEYKGSYIYPGSNRTIFGKNSIQNDRYGYIDEEGYFITNDLQTVKSVPGPDITYKINKDGFRSQHFKNLDKNKTNVLFSGCSSTFGEGMLKEYLWTSLLTDKINSQNKDVYDVSAMGASIRLIIKNTLSFVRNYGNPDFIFIMLPDPHRDLQYNKDTENFINCFPHTMWLNKPNVGEFKTKKHFTLNYIPENTMLTGVDYLHMLEDICESNNIKLLWSTWSNESNSVYNKLNFRYYIEKPDIENLRSTINEKNTDFPFTNNENNLPYWAVAGDDQHPGTFWTTYIADLFYKEAKERGYEI